MRTPSVARPPARSAGCRPAAGTSANADQRGVQIVDHDPAVHDRQSRNAGPTKPSSRLVGQAHVGVCTVAGAVGDRHARPPACSRSESAPAVAVSTCPSRLRAPCCRNCDPAPTFPRTSGSRHCHHAGLAGEQLAQRHDGSSDKPPDPPAPVGSRWPAMTRETAGASPCRRSRTDSSMWPAAVRPKRASHARGSASVLTMVPVASSVRRALNGSESVSAADHGVAVQPRLT